MTGTGRVRVRYRPFSDSASGSVDLGDVAVRRLERSRDDTDTVVEWAHTDEGPVLNAFQILHCRTRLDELTAAGPLPPKVAGALRELVDTSASGPEDDLAAAVAHSAERVLDLDLADLRSTATSTPQPVASATEARALARSLTGFAEALGRQPNSATRRTGQLVGALLELASALAHGGGSHATGALARTRAAVRGGLPLTDLERRRLADLLDEARDPHAWTRVTTELDRLTRQIGGSPPRGRP